MDLEQVKQKVRRGDVKLAHEICKVSKSIIYCVLDGTRSHDENAPKGHKAFNTLISIIQNRDNMLQGK